ncbi:PREDICTED: uncharacterized protein LOC108575276 [Habropoda laboriosa]|uniref:uncharacterized protein LOC108575276 n=1 Tax=Habropoda laboriosa TaxID=597456 RepID=UPI00083E4B33|nr:PREDICTED: uncharacterized protein LOC108575276 [Habropoda laboriosa]
MDEKKFSYLFSSTEPLLTPNVSGRIFIPEEQLQKHYVEIVDDDGLNLLSHSDMSWGSLEDRYVPFEIQSEEDSSSITSTSSTSSSNLSFSLLDQVPLSIDHDILECATSSSWSSYALDINLWNDDRAPVVKLRHLKEMLFDDLEFWGLFTDRLIGVGKSFLTKSPENGLYILSKCIMRNMDAYSLRVIDLKFNRINDLLELSNIKGLIHEIDLRGNGCTKWPNYKSVLLFSMPSICIIDGIDVSTSEKIAAVTLFASPVNLTAARTITKLTLLEQLSTPKIDLHVRPYDETSPPLIVLTGPSAVKKLSLALQIAQTLPKKVKYCQWYTTKESEPNETDFEPYIFVNREEFNDMSRHGEFLAIQERLGNSYGFHHNQITSLILENKIGITQADLHAAIQIIKRYSNSKAVLVLTKSEQIHRERVQEKFYIIENVQTSSIDVLGKQHDNATIDIALENKTLFDIKTDKSVTEIEKEISDNKFQKQKINLHTKDYSTLQDHKGLRVILDEHANIIIEDEHLKRKRHQEKLLQRRDTLVRGADFPLIEELSESVSSEEILTKKSEAKQPEHMKDFYTEVIIKSRKIYLDQHMNKPGFFSLVVLTDNYFKAFNKLINFIYELYINYPLEKPKFSSELNHFSDVAVPTMVNSVVDEMIQSLSTSILQRKTLLRMYGVTSWKELVPNQRIENSINIAD